MTDFAKKDDADPTKWYKLVHPGGPGGFTRIEPRPQVQDSEAIPGEGYVVAFFPKIDTLGPASLDWPSTWETLSRSPEAAISKFMDKIRRGEKWETYRDAGHCVRHVRIIDLGPADGENEP